MECVWWPIRWVDNQSEADSLTDGTSCCILLYLNSCRVCLFWTHSRAAALLHSALFLCLFNCCTESRHNKLTRKNVDMWLTVSDLYFCLCVCVFSDKNIGFRGLGCLPESGCVSETKISRGASADKGQSQKQTQQHNNCPDGKLEFILNSLFFFLFF